MVAALAAVVFGYAVCAAQHAPLAKNHWVTPNFKDADISQIAAAVREMTGKNIVIDPSVHEEATLLASAPMSPDAFYQAFLSIVQAHRLVAIGQGKVIKVIREPNGIITRVIDVKNLSVVRLTPFLQPLISKYGSLSGYVPSNSIIVSDRASNVNRVTRIIQQIDRRPAAEIP